MQAQAPDPAPVRILVVEDNLLTRSGSVMLLSTQEDFEVVGEGTSGEEGLALYEALRPDVVLADLRMPGIGGLAMIEALGRATPPARIVVLTHYDGDEDIFASVRAGALGYLTKETGRQDLFEAIRTVARGERFMPHSISSKLAQRVARPELTPREQEVLERMATGKSNRDIAAGMSLSEKTVTMYVSHIFQKLGVKSRTEAVLAAMQRGLIKGA